MDNSDTIWIEVLLITLMFSIILITLITSDTRQTVHVFTTFIIGFIGLIMYKEKRNDQLDYITLWIPLLLLLGIAIGNLVVDISNYLKLKDTEKDLMKNDSKYKSLKITGDVFFLLMAGILFGFKYSNNLKAYFEDDDTHRIVITIIFIIYLLIWASSVYMLHVKNRRVNNLTDEKVVDDSSGTTSDPMTGGIHGNVDIVSHTHVFPS